MSSSRAATAGECAGSRAHQSLSMRVLTMVMTTMTMLLAASPAHAQPAPLQAAPFTGANTNGGPPPVSWIKLGKTGDTLQNDQRGDAIHDLAIEPLRLSLMGEFVTHPTNDPMCSGSPEASGSLTGMSSFPAQQTLGMHVFGGGSSNSLHAPRLSLFGMSRLGCGLDSLTGGGVTFTVPITKSTFFVLSGGAIYLPHGGANGTPTSSKHARVDIVFARDGGRSYNVGVGVFHGSPRVSVGGAF